MKLLVIDNYDSFTYNLVHLLDAIGGAALTVLRNDQVSPQEALNFDKILLSPGPGIPQTAGAMPEIIRACAPEKSILGVCLGHQAIAEAFGGSILNLSKVYHGVASELHVHDRSEALFAGLPDRFEVGRYHSWMVDASTLPPALSITASTADGTPMALKHAQFNVRGVQFHPESVLTPLGKNLLENWLRC